MATVLSGFYILSEIVLPFLVELSVAWFIAWLYSLPCEVNFWSKPYVLILIVIKLSGPNFPKSWIFTTKSNSQLDEAYFCLI